MSKFSGPKTFIAIVLFCLTASLISWAQQPDEAPDGTIDAATRTQVIDSILKRLNDSYVFPDDGKEDGSCDSRTC